MACPTCSRLDHADGDDRRVGALAVGELLGELGGLLHRLDGVGGAELLGLLALERHRVDGDDVRRPGVRRALHGVDADAADAHDDRRCGRAGPRAELTAEPQPVPTPQPTRQTLSSGMSSVDLHRGVGRRPWWSRRTSRCRTSGRPGCRCRRASGGSRWGPPSASRRAGRRRGRTGSACPQAHQRQCPQEGRNEKTTWSPSLRPLVFGAGLGDDAGALVAAGERVDADRDVAGGDVVVGVAQAGGRPS